MVKKTKELFFVSYVRLVLTFTLYFKKQNIIITFVGSILPFYGIISN